MSRRHRKHDRSSRAIAPDRVARSRHPAGTTIAASIAVPVAALSGCGLLMVITTPVQNLDAQRKLDGRRNNRPPSRVDGRAENGRFADGHRGQNGTARDTMGPWALVTWSESMAMRRPSYWPTEAAAEDAAAVFRYEGLPYSVVDITRKARGRETSDQVLPDKRASMVVPYPASASPDGRSWV